MPERVALGDVHLLRRVAAVQTDSRQAVDHRLELRLVADDNSSLFAVLAVGLLQPLSGILRLGVHGGGGDRLYLPRLSPRGGRQGVGQQPDVLADERKRLGVGAKILDIIPEEQRTLLVLEQLHQLSFNGQQVVESDETVHPALCARTELLPMADHVPHTLAVVALACLLQFVAQTVVDSRQGVPQRRKMCLHRFGYSLLPARVALVQQVNQPVAHLFVEFVPVEVGQRERVAEERVNLRLTYSLVDIREVRQQLSSPAVEAVDIHRFAVQTLAVYAVQAAYGEQFVLLTQRAEAVKQVAQSHYLRCPHC